MADNVTGEDVLAYMDTENNDGEFLMAVERIEEAVARGRSYEDAVRLYGIRGHPAFKDFWPATRYWGDAVIAREALGLPLGD